MKILFLCGSLEPGRDGVGDYVRQLIQELWHQGHQVGAIALNDRYITSETMPLLKLVGTESMIRRLPASWSVQSRFKRAQQLVEEFQPNWVSLQFVPYAFNSKGLPFALGKSLLRVARGRQVHIMMHEGWVGADSGTGLKRQLLSYLQKKVVNRLIDHLQPAVIHTHLPIYLTRLQQLGWRVLPLPLFSNIPVLLQSIEIDPTVFRIGVFSQVDTNPSFINFIIGFAKHLIQWDQYCQVQVLLIGGEPAKMQALKTMLDITSSVPISVHHTGFLEPAQLSSALQSCQLGITPVPRNGLGKSGSVAAFLAHGIPVAAPYVHPEASSKDIGFFYPKLCSTILIHPDIELYKSARLAAQEAQNIIKVSTIARTFLSDLLSN